MGLCISALVSAGQLPLGFFNMITVPILNGKSPQKQDAAAHLGISILGKCQRLFLSTVPICMGAPARSPASQSTPLRAPACLLAEPSGSRQEAVDASCADLSLGTNILSALFPIEGQTGLVF